MGDSVGGLTAKGQEGTFWELSGVMRLWHLFFFFFLVSLHSTWDLSSLTRD